MPLYQPRASLAFADGHGTLCMPSHTATSGSKRLQARSCKLTGSPQSSSSSCLPADTYRSPLQVSSAAAQAQTSRLAETSRAVPAGTSSSQPPAQPAQQTLQTAPPRTSQQQPHRMLETARPGPAGSDARQPSAPAVPSLQPRSEASEVPLASQQQAGEAQGQRAGAADSSGLRREGSRPVTPGSAISRQPSLGRVPATGADSQGQSQKSLAWSGLSDTCLYHLSAGCSDPVLQPLHAPCSISCVREGITLCLACISLASFQHSHLGGRCTAQASALPTIPHAAADS